MDFEVWVRFGVYYLWRFVGFSAVIVAIASVALFISRKRKYAHPIKISGFVIVALYLGWLIVFLSTARWTLTRFALDSESSRTAEYAYRHFFEVKDLNQAVALAIDRNQWDNVRFYAACRVADILITNENRSTERGVFE
jgi:hypothetical protein